MVKERLGELAILRVRNSLAAPANASQPTRPAGDWYSSAESAARLNIREDTLLRRLDLPENRRRYGYPRWDGFQWWLSSFAIEPETYAAYMATMPAYEPLEELLPPWCVRQGQSMAPRDARTDREREALLRRATGPSPSDG